MRIRSPSSRRTASIRISFSDATIAAFSPILALYLCNALILSHDSVSSAIGYSTISLISSLIAFAAFGIYDGIPRYISIRDVTAVAKAVLVSELIATGTWFLLTRLEGIPRSAPVIHALIMGVGLLSARMIAHISDVKGELADRPRGPPRHIIVIGLNELSVLYIKFVNSSTRARHRVTGVVDDEPRWIGRSIDGVQVFGPLAEFESLIDEFRIHGVPTEAVVVFGQESLLSAETLDKMRRVCMHRNIEFLAIPYLFDVGPVSAMPSPLFEPSATDFALPSYFRFKRAIDICGAIILLVLLAPVLFLSAMLVIIDVGSPVLFWQRRIGLKGRDFLLHKFRTLHPALGFQGFPSPEEPGSSSIGQLLRKTRLDELPQLLNVLMGHMSLIGPRPLLAEDQANIPPIRLMVRPGITGWAQVNGATLLAPGEKACLDAWYIRNASLWLDLRIAWLTVLTLVRGHRRSERALACADKLAQRDVKIVDLHKGTALGMVASVINSAPDEASPHPVAGLR